MSKHLVRWAAAVAAAVVIALVLTRERARPTLARAATRASRRSSRATGRLQGLAYRLGGGRPDPNATGKVLADRVRSTLGPLEKRLDIPRVHVTAEDHVVLLHGEVPTQEDAALVEAAVAEISGVLGTESYLHVGPLRATERPSGGAARHHPSAAKVRLIESAGNAGAPDDRALAIVRAVLAFLADRVPRDELDQFLSHLPGDVTTLCVAPHRVGHSRERTVAELVAGLSPATDPLPPPQAEHVIEAVFGALRELVPEEDHDIAAVLPEELRDFWLASMPH
jgi:uncharacterized protein (DUF2267 family)